MTIVNLNSVLRQMRQFGAGVREGAAEGLAAEAKRIFLRSQELVPVAVTDDPDAGKLKRSGYVTDVEQHGGRMSVEVGYTGRAAAIIHEDLESRHEIGQAKWLEAAVHETAPGRAARIGAAALAAAKRRSGAR